MYPTTQNTKAAEMPHRTVTDRKSSIFGIRLYKDQDICHLGEKDTRNRWNILLFKSGMYTREWGFKKSGLYIAPVFSISDGLQVGDEFKGYLLSVPFSSWKTLDIYNMDRIFGSYRYSSYIELSQADFNGMEMLMMILDNAVVNGESTGNSQELTHICRAIIATIHRYYSSLSVSKHSETGNRIVDKFLVLLESYCLEEKKLDFYAKEMNVTAKYLSYVISHVTGKRACTWIAESVIENVNKRLLSTTNSIHEVAEYAGFDHPSEFCRFYRRHTGMTPMAYRKQNRSREISK